MFKNISAAVDCQDDYGGKLHKITEQEVMEDDEGGIYEGDETRSQYILNIKDTAELVNGFRYIKELLLQQHNFTMYEAYNKLRRNNISMYSVKTDAFVINSKDVDLTLEDGELVNMVMISFYPFKGMSWFKMS